MLETDRLMFAAQHPVYEAHGVPEADRLFLFWALDRAIEDDVETTTNAATVAAARIADDDYEELLASHGRGHRRNRRWLATGKDGGAVPTRRGRALLGALIAVTPGWQRAA